MPVLNTILCRIIARKLGLLDKRQMLTTTLNKLFRAFFWLAAIAITIIALIALTMHFYIFPNINHYKDDIANKITEKTKLNVDIGQIKVDWKKLEPHLTLSDITVFDQQNRPALILQDSEVSVSWLSVAKLHLQLAEIRLQNPALTIRRLKNGEVFVAGIKIAGQSNSMLSNWLLKQNKIKIRNAEIVWHDEMRQAPALSLKKLDLDLLSPPWKSLFKQHRLAITATPSIGTQKPIIFMSEFFGGDLNKLNDWYGDLSVRLTDAHIPDFKPWLDYPIQVQSAKGNAIFHLEFDHLTAKKIVGLVDLNNIEFQLKPSQKPLNFSKLKGKVTWRNNVDQISLDLENIDLKQKHLMLNQVNASYTESTNKVAKHQQVKFDLKDLNLKRIDSLLHNLPIKLEGIETITQLSPRGQLKDLSISWEGIAGKTNAYQVNSHFQQLSLTPHKKIPGFNNLTGKLQATHKGGTVTLDTKNATLNFDNVLRQPIPDTQLKGNINWLLEPNKNKISFNHLSITNPHLKGNVNGHLSFGSLPPTIDLTGAFSNVQVSAAHYYFPKFLRTDTLKWLDNAFLAGTGEAVKLTVKGKLSDFPFVDANNNLDLKKGLFRVASKVLNGEIHYGNNWPNIQNIQTDMLFEGNQMVLSNSTGNIVGNHIDQATITIPALRSTDPRLHVTAVTNGPVHSGILFINQSPISKITQGFTDNLTTAGHGKLNLQLEIPLKHARDSQVKGEYEFTNAMMNSATIPALSQVNGNLSFTQKGITGKKIKAMAFNTPITVDVTTMQDKSISIDVDTRINNQLLTHFVKNPAHYISGSSPMAANIVVKKPNVNMTFKSDLTGVTSYLPAPFNKSSATPMDLLIKKQQTPANDLMHFYVGQLFTAEVISNRTNEKNVIKKINLHIDDRNTDAIVKPFPNNLVSVPNGIELIGHLDYANADDWQETLEDILLVEENTTPLTLTHLKLDLQQLDLFGRRLNNVSIDGQSKDNGFIATITGDELTGDLIWKAQHNGQLIAKLTHLSIPEKAPIVANSNPLYTKPDVDSGYESANENYPAINIDSKSFVFKNKQLGALVLEAKPAADAWDIKQLKIINPDSTLTATGVWKAISYNPMTQFDVTWEIDDLGKTLGRLGYPDTLSRGKGGLTGQITWTGSPHEFDALALNGALKFDIRKGEILKVKPGVGRLLGLVSLQSLPRRLTLDFRDLFSNGFAFDKIKSSINIESGVMRTDNFKMVGPAADVEIKGETNLKTETQHLFVKVLPQISDTFSLAALAGGPLAGAVAFLAQKVLKDPLNKIISTQYEIIGTWDKPVEVKVEKEEKNDVSNVMQ